MVLKSVEILRMIRRDLDNVLIPELHSEHARTLASMIDGALRHLIARENKMGALLGKLHAEHESLRASLKLDVLEGSGENVFADELRRRVRTDIRSRPRFSPILDGVCVKAIAAESRFLADLVDYEQALTHPTYSTSQAAALAVTPERLTNYLGTKLAGRDDLRVVRVYSVLGGFSKETILVDIDSRAGAEGVVIRRDNPYGPVDSTVVDEFQLVRGLFRAHMPVAEPLLVERDDSVLGYPFMVSRRAQGVTVPHTVGISVGGEHLETARALAEVLAKLHGLDLASLDLPRTYYDTALSTQEALLRNLALWEHSWFESTDRSSITLPLAFEWLRLNLPTDSRPVSLVHGDAGPHNLLMHEGRPSAMLDWEVAHVGDPVEDLTYCRLWIDQIMRLMTFCDFILSRVDRHIRWKRQGSIRYMSMCAR